MTMHLPFADRTEAGRLLARELSLKSFPADTVVLAVAPGGVPGGYAVADRLGFPLDIVTSQKILVPWQPDITLGTLAGSASVLDSFVIQNAGVPEEDLDDLVASAKSEMRKREVGYRGSEPELNIEGRALILTDDGIATGDTMVAMIRHARTAGAAGVMVAIPVGPKAACARLRDNADSLVCLATPEFFISTGEWYREYPEVTADEVRSLMKEARRNLKTKLRLSARA